MQDKIAQFTISTDYLVFIFRVHVEYNIVRLITNDYVYFPENMSNSFRVCELTDMPCVAVNRSK